MNRCFKTPLAGLLALLVVAGTAVLAPAAASAQALVREFPAAAKRGMLEVTAPPAVLINGTATRLSPGARIKGVNNALVMSGTLIGSRLLVNYVLDPQNMVHDVWILSTEEALVERKGLEPVRNYVFSSEADKPKVDDGKTPFDQLPKFPKQ